ncbi:hypothetical protein PIB30_018520 [Stylosanthes scabra]|uniref:Uncharacterized protein n=1 Tax=Stylosanthes scabra TaxID=79078 RepID=A0ABU6Y530_9FABA|nr:hypothetical protein [Stylosanthes scabra]
MNITFHNRVVHCSTFVEAWETINYIFIASSNTRIQSIKTQLRSTRKQLSPFSWHLRAELPRKTNLLSLELGIELGMKLGITEEEEMAGEVAFKATNHNANFVVKWVIMSKPVTTGLIHTFRVQCKPHKDKSHIQPPCHHHQLPHSMNPRPISLQLLASQTPLGI